LAKQLLLSLNHLPRNPGFSAFFIYVLLSIGKLAVGNAGKKAVRGR